MTLCTDCRQELFFEDRQSPNDRCDACYIVALLTELEEFRASDTCIHRYSCMSCGMRVGPLLEWEA